MAAVMHFDVDAIALTGGMAYSERFCEEISSYLKKTRAHLPLPPARRK